MEENSAKNLLKKLFESHNIEFNEENDWILPYSKLPAIRSAWYPYDDRLCGLLQIEVFLEEGQILEECFAGFPTENGKLLDAFENFARNSLHVLMSAFWEKHNSNQVEKEIWNFKGNNFTLHIGPFGNRGGDGIHPRVPKNTFKLIKKAIMYSDINYKYNWFRIFYSNLGNNEKVYEALKNNKPWHEGLNALKAVNWKVSNEYYSTRNFIIAVKNT